MDFEEERRRIAKKLKQAEERLARQEERKRAAKKTLASIRNDQRDRAEKWHRFSIAHHDREIGYTGEHALARMVIRMQPFEKFVAIVGPFSNGGQRGLANAEFAAVVANIVEWTKVGRTILLNRDRDAYAAEHQQWEAWLAANPGGDWRARPMTANQSHLVRRIVEALGIDLPKLSNRGAAHDWIAANGGNPRLNQDKTA